MKFLSLNTEYSDAILMLPDGDLRELISGLLSYQAAGIKPEISSVAAKVLFTIMAKDIDAFREASEKKSAGRKKTPEDSSSNYKLLQVTSSNFPDEKREREKDPLSPEKERKNQREKENPLSQKESEREEREGTGARAHEAEVFKPPTESQVRAYCSEQMISVDAARFVSHYAARGWMMGPTPMRDWRAACMSWSLNGRDPPNKPAFARRKPVTDIDERTYTEAELNALCVDLAAYDLGGEA